MRYLSIAEILVLHRRVVEQAGGSQGIRDLGALESAVAQPSMAYENQELYPSLIEKATALGFSLISNHPFVDGNKRVGHAAVETFLILNGHDIQASVEDQEKLILDLADGRVTREEFLIWLRDHTQPLRS